MAGLNNNNFIHVPPDFWDKVALSEKKLLVLDYDGTLAPFKIERMEAHPLPGTMDVIRDITDEGSTFVAIVSGRPAAELVTLIGSSGVRLIGGHGFEVQKEDGSFEVMSLDDDQKKSLERAFDKALLKGYKDLLERKHASVAVHTRSLSDRDAERVHRELKDLWEPETRNDKLVLRPFKGGMELRAVGTDKGTALKKLIEEAGEGALVVYIGDDNTDEDAFKMLPKGAFGFKVGDPSEPTCASGRLSDCAAVKMFLEKWRDIVCKRS